MKMFLSTLLAGFVPYTALLACGVNVFIAGFSGLVLMILVASIITKIDFGYWNPF